MVGNYHPALDDVDPALRRRFNIIPFVNRPNPDMIDLDLGEKLKDEYPAILRWMTDGCLLWQKYGLMRPASILTATEEYFADQDFFGLWLNEDCIVESGNTDRWATSADLFRCWKQYADLASEEAGTQRTMSDRLRQHGLRQDRKRYQGRQLRVWLGVSLRQAGQFNQV